MTNEDNNTNLKDDNVPGIEKNIESNLNNTPVKSIYKLSDPSTINNGAGGITPTRPTSLSTSTPSSTLLSPVRSFSNGSPASLERRHIVTMNMILEHVLQTTLRSDDATHNLRYIKLPCANSSSNDNYISHVMVSELICTRLTTGLENSGIYLSNYLSIYYIIYISI
jgi:hypothetical protein